MLLKIVVTENGDGPRAAPDGATLFLFDKNQRYLRSQQVSQDDIANGKPVEISYPRGNPPEVVVWGNIQEYNDVANPGEGTPMQELFVSLKKHPEEGFYLAPGELYHGRKQLVGEKIEVVPISQKTGRLSITVKGVPKDASPLDYCFTVASGYSRYDFAGTPMVSHGLFKLSGEFRGDKFVTPQPHTMIHHPAEVEQGKAVAVSFWQGQPFRTENPLAMADKDSGGRPIVIEAAKTTNVLLELAADVKVSVLITDWDVIHQWDEW